jgi:hypothetical protein
MVYHRYIFLHFLLHFSTFPIPFFCISYYIFCISYYIFLHFLFHFSAFPITFFCISYYIFLHFLLHFSAFPMPRAEFLTAYDVRWILWWDRVIVRFVEIGGIVDHHCLNFLYTLMLLFDIHGLVPLRPIRCPLCHCSI